MPRRMRDRSTKPRRTPSVLDRLNPDAAGIDCGSAEHFVAVPPDRDAMCVRSFATFTGDLRRLADWLTVCRIRSVAIEATGVYWIPLYEILEARGFQVLLVNARHVKNVPGRKSDVADCEWLRDLHVVGLVRGSFRPPAGIVALRAYLRHRETLIQHGGSCIQRMQKALIQMNVQLTLVVSDVSGETGLRIVRDIVAGQTDPTALARHRNYRCRASEAEIVAALTGHYQPEHVFALGQHLEAVRFCPTPTGGVRPSDRGAVTAAGDGRHASDHPGPGRPPATGALPQRPSLRRADRRCISSVARTSPNSMALAPTTPCV